MLKGFLLGLVMVLNAACGSMNPQIRKPDSKLDPNQALLAKYQKQTLEVVLNID